MSGWAWLGVALLGWVAVSTAAGVLVGRALRRAENGDGFWPNGAVRRILRS